MADLLGEVDVNVAPRLPLKTIRTASRHKTRILSPPVSRENKLSHHKPVEANNNAHLLNTPPLEPAYGDNDDYMGGMEEDVFPPSDQIPSSPITNVIDRKGQQNIKLEEDDDDMEVAQAIGDHKLKSASVNMSGSRPAHKIAKSPAYPSPASSSPTRPPAEVVDASAWNDVTSKLNVLSSQGPETASFGKLQVEDAIEEDGSLHFFWIDYTEVKGSLCLFGKVKDKKSGTYVSAFVKVDNILRKLYFLPRTYRQSESSG